MNYEKPYFDPFEVFQPSPTFIKEVIRDLNNSAYQLLKDMEQIKKYPWADWLVEELALKHTKILNRVKSLRYRLSVYEKTGRWNIEARPGRITDQDVTEAKRRPIQDFYQGKLRRNGKRLLGACPFHQERTASFVIYSDQNTYHCYGCQANGDVISYVQKSQNIGFIEAIKFLIGK